MSEKKRSIFITDDHQIVIDGLASLLEKQPDLIFAGYANDGEEAIKKISILQPDLVIMDLNMPKVNGLKASESLLREHPHLKIVILSLIYDKRIVDKLVKLGVAGYALKNTPANELLEGIRMVLKGSRFYSGSLTESLFSSDALEVSRESNVRLLALLNERELQLLKKLASGFSSKEISEMLHLSPQTVDSYRKTLLRKLEAKNVADLIRIALKEGLIE